MSRQGYQSDPGSRQTSSRLLPGLSSASRLPRRYHSVVPPSTFLSSPGVTYQPRRQDTEWNPRPAPTPPIGSGTRGRNPPTPISDVPGYEYILVRKATSKVASRPTPPRRGTQYPDLDTHAPPPRNPRIPPPIYPNEPGNVPGKVNTPQVFSGSPKQTAIEFLDELDAFFSDFPHRFHDEEDKIIYAGSLLKGKAHAWFRAATTDGSKPTLSTFDAFRTLLLHQFNPDNTTPAQFLMPFRMRNSDRFDEFIDTFDRIKEEVYGRNSEFVTILLQSLPQRLRQALADSFPYPQGYDAVVTRCLQADNRYWQKQTVLATLRKGCAVNGLGHLVPPEPSTQLYTRRADDSFGPPIPTLTHQGKLSPEEKMRRRFLRLCLYCGGGHDFEACYLKHTPNISASRMAPFAKAAAATTFCAIATTPNDPANPRVARERTSRNRNAQKLTIPIRFSMGGPIIDALIDSGSARSHLDSVKLVRNLGLPSARLDTPISVVGIDGTSTALATHTVDFNFACGNHHFMSNDVQWLVSRITGPQKVILGYDFLNHFTPTIDWRTNSITFDSDLFCRSMPSIFPTTDRVRIRQSSPSDSGSDPGDEVSTASAPTLAREPSPTITTPESSPAQSPSKLLVNLSIRKKLLVPAEHDADSEATPPPEDVNPQGNLKEPENLERYRGIFRKVWTSQIVFSLEGKQLFVLPPHREHDFKIHTSLVPPSRAQIFTHCRHTPQEITFLRKHFQNLERLNLIQQVTHDYRRNEVARASAFTSPSGQLEVFIDYTNLNLASKPYVAESHVSSRERIARMMTNKVFSKIRLRFHLQQLRVRPQDEPHTRFRTPYGTHYDWKVMPDGLKNTSAHWNDFLGALYPPSLFPFVTAIDDEIIVFSKSTQQHFKDMCRVLTTLDRHGLRADKDQCLFHQSGVDFQDWRIGFDPETESILGTE